MSTKTGEKKVSSSQVVGKTGTADKITVVDDSEIKTGEETENKDSSAEEEKVLLTFKKNRGYELHLGRYVYKFKPHGSTYVLKKHLEKFEEDWTQAKKLFVKGKETVTTKKVTKKEESE